MLSYLICAARKLRPRLLSNDSHNIGDRRQRTFPIRCFSPANDSHHKLQCRHLWCTNGGFSTFRTNRLQSCLAPPAQQQLFSLNGPEHDRAQCDAHKKFTSRQGGRFENAL